MLDPQAAQSSLCLLMYTWFFTTYRGGIKLSRPIGAAAALPRLRGKVYPCPMLCISSPNTDWMQRRHVSKLGNSPQAVS